MKKTSKSQKEEIKNENIEIKPAPAPVLNPETIGVFGEVKQKPSEPIMFKITAQGGLFLRETPPKDINTTDSTFAGATIACMNYGERFVELKREGNWSYGNYMGKSGWACNKFFTEE